GGGRLRLVRQLVTESLVLAMAGAVGGLLMSAYITRYLLISMPDMLPISLSFDLTPDRRVLAATIGFATVAALVFGLGPAWRLARTDAVPALKDQIGTPSGRRWLRWLTARDTLVMGQLALSFVMLTVAGLFVRGAIEGAATDPGFTLERGILVNVDTTLVNYPPERSKEFFRALLEGLRRTPGVTSAALASHMPFGEFEDRGQVQLPGPSLRFDDPAATGKLFEATTASVSGDYFRTLGVAMRRGREFTEAETSNDGGDPIAIIDETLARDLFGAEDPIGRLIQMPGPGDQADPLRLRVVGVAAGIRGDLFDSSPRHFLYRPLGQEPRQNLYLHAATGAPTAAAESAMLPGIRELVRTLEPRTPIVSLETRPMFRERNLMLAILRTGATIFAAFGVAALFLAAVGVYGVKAYLVSRRTREIGVRMALGADGRDVVWMVLREGLTLVTVGLLVGAGLSFLTGQVMRGMLFQGRALDLTIVSISAVTLVASVLLASWLPARRATRVAPTVALRAN
ncbi:MAG TPA: FtsX-like permease family protein, partial [Vicinamibacterales bacterium]|nr:FtsX-like permease family protein [Vicinamibacterales bacterium]